MTEEKRFSGPKIKRATWNNFENFFLKVFVSSKFIDPFNLNVDVVHSTCLNKRIEGCYDFALVHINHQNMTNGYGYLVAIGC